MSQKVTGADSDEEQEVLQFKLVILGDGAVGKTSLCRRFSEDIFAKRYVGADAHRLLVRKCDSSPELLVVINKQSALTSFPSN